MLELKGMLDEAESMTELMQNQRFKFARTMILRWAFVAVWCGALFALLAWSERIALAVKITGWILLALTSPGLSSFGKLFESYEDFCKRQ